MLEFSESEIKGISRAIAIVGCLAWFGAVALVAAIVIAICWLFA